MKTFFHYLWEVTKLLIVAYILFILFFVIKNAYGQKTSPSESLIQFTKNN